MQKYHRMPENTAKHIKVLCRKPQKHPNFVYITAQENIGNYAGLNRSTEECQKTLRDDKTTFDDRRRSSMRLDRIEHRYTPNHNGPITNLNCYYMPIYFLPTIIFVFIQ